MKQKPIDKELQQMFQMASNYVEPPKDLFDNIQRGIKLKEEQTMKNVFRTKHAKGFVIAAAVCVVSISCYAASKIKSYESHSYTKWETLPTVSEVKKESGFAPKFVDKFANGYTFQSAAPGEAQANGENDEVIGTYKQVSFQYQKADSPKDVYVSINVHEKQSYSEPMTGEEVQLDGMKGYYDESNYRFYPPDVEPTEEDRKLEAEGKLYISYGSSEIESTTFQSIQWEADGLEYIMMASNANMDKAELISMVNELMAK